MNKIIGVSQLNRLIEQEISINPFLKSVAVEGEVSRVTKHGSGHYYFTIKDQYSSIDCVMFRSQVQKLKEDFFQGDLLVFYGKISLYPQNAKLQLYVHRVEHLGEGVYQKAFYALKDALEKEGVIGRKTPEEISPTPEKILLITSETSAAYKDFIKIFHERNPFCSIRLIPTLMQGETTVESLHLALDQLEDEDLVVITRGGGNYEDLRFFNDEKLARRIADMSTPVISAIGHEIDFTIIELVSSLRGATPSEAAQKATEDIRSLFLQNEEILHSQSRWLKEQLQRQKDLLANFKETLVFQMENKGSFVSQHLDVLKEKMTGWIKDQLTHNKVRLEHLHEMIEGRNPMNLLQSGYTITLLDGFVPDKDQLKIGKEMTTLFDQIEVTSQITSVKERKNRELS